MENRQSERQTAVRQSVDVSFNRHLHCGIPVSDLSLGGIFLQLCAAPSPTRGTEFSLVFRAAGTMRLRFYVSVVRVTDAGIGCQFQHLGSRELVWLKKLMAHMQNEHG